MNFIIKIPSQTYFNRFEYYSVHQSKIGLFDQYTIINSTHRLNKVQHRFRLFQILMMYPKLKFFCIGFKNDKKPKRFRFSVYNKLKNNNFL